MTSRPAKAVAAAAVAHWASSPRSASSSSAADAQEHDEPLEAWLRARGVCGIGRAADGSGVFIHDTKAEAQRCVRAARPLPTAVGEANAAAAAIRAAASREAFFARAVKPSRPVTSSSSSSAEGVDGSLAFVPDDLCITATLARSSPFSARCLEELARNDTTGELDLNDENAVILFLAFAKVPTPITFIARTTDASPLLASAKLACSHPRPAGAGAADAASPPSSSSAVAGAECSDAVAEWAPYIERLPSLFHTPLSYPDADLLLFLRGTVLLEGCRAVRSDLRRRFAAMRRLSPLLASAEGFDFELLRWAHRWVLSSDSCSGTVTLRWAHRWAGGS
jgi:hypothetical protein